MRKLVKIFRLQLWDLFEHLLVSKWATFNPINVGQTLTLSIRTSGKWGCSSHRFIGEIITASDIQSRFKRVNKWPLLFSLGSLKINKCPLISIVNLETYTPIWLSVIFFVVIFEIWFSSSYNFFGWRYHFGIISMLD